jgi:hypothetical protein
MTFDCEPCSYFAEHGWIGSGRSHCPKCHRTWTGKAQAHCRTCCVHFSGISAFKLHLRGVEDVKHLDPATIRTKDGKRRLVKRFDQYGEIWGQPGEVPWKAERAAL